MRFTARGTDRQADRQTRTETHKQTQKDRHTNEETDRLTDRKTSLGTNAIGEVVAISLCPECAHHNQKNGFFHTQNSVFTSAFTSGKALTSDCAC